MRAIPKLGIEAEVFEIEQLFGFFDPDNDGSIELKELSKKLKGPSAAFGRDLARELEQVEAALRTADASEARVRKAWDAYDVDASDSIDLGEVMSLMDDLGLLKALTSDPAATQVELEEERRAVKWLCCEELRRCKIACPPRCSSRS